MQVRNGDIGPAWEISWSQYPSTVTTLLNNDPLKGCLALTRPLDERRRPRSRVLTLLPVELPVLLGSLRIGLQLAETGLGFLGCPLHAPSSNLACRQHVHADGIVDVLGSIPSNRRKLVGILDLSE